MAGLFVLSALAGAAALVAGLRALRLGALAVLPDAGGRHFVVPLVIALAACYAVAAIASYRVPRATWNRQVPFVMRSSFAPLRASVAYSAVLGAGIYMRISSPAFYVVPVATLLAPSWPLALVPALLYAFARATIVAAVSVALSERYRSAFDGLLGWISYQRRVWTAVQAIVLAGATVAGLAIGLSHIPS